MPLSSAMAARVTQAELLAGVTDVDGPAARITSLTIAAGRGALVDNGNGTWNYTPALNDDSAVTFDYTASDGTLTAASTATLDITPVNDVALIGGVAAGTVTEDAATPNLTAAGALTITDADPGESSFVAQAGTRGALGTFTVNSAGGWTYTADNTQAAIQRLAAGAELRETFTVTSADGTASRDVVITIHGVNDAPLASNQVYTTVSTVSRVFGVNDFGYTDAEGDALAKIRVASLPGSGTLLLGGAPVAANQEISAADITAGRLRFVPNETISTSVSTAFAFQVNDGTVYSAATYAVTLNVTPLRNENAPAQPSPAPVAVVSAALPAVTPPAAVAAPAPAPAASSAAGAAIAPPAAAVPVLPPVTLIDSPEFLAGTPRSDGFAELPRVRVAESSAATQLGALSFTLGLGVTETRVDSLGLPEAPAGERAAAATSSTVFLEELNRLRDNTRADEVLERNIIVSSVATGAGMSVGYVLWLLRGGLLLSSLLSSLPAWRFVDPLPVLGRLRDDDEEDLDDDSVEDMVRAGEPPPPKDGRDA
jgi:VCBS repeat-containing protein